MLAEKLKGTAITSNSLHPGVIKTKLLDAMGFNGTPDLSYGAQTSVFLASADEAEKITGKYWNKQKVEEPSELVYDKDAQRKLWKYSEQLLNINWE